jgi:hypothetical protein
MQCDPALDAHEQAGRLNTERLEAPLAYRVPNVASARQVDITSPLPAPRRSFIREFT